MYRAYAADPRMRINVGIRRRLAPLLENSRRADRAAERRCCSRCPARRCIYYGDEIGMGDNIYLGDRNGVRTPMQWTGDRNAGFSRADPARLYAPLIMDPVYGYQAVNVEAQERSPSSLLNWMRRMIALRKRHTRVRPRHARVPASREPEGPRLHARATRTKRFCVVANLARSVQPAELDLSAFNGRTPVEMVGATEFPRIGELPYFLTLGPYSFYWFVLRNVMDTRAGRSPISTYRLAAPRGVSVRGGACDRPVSVAARHQRLLSVADLRGAAGEHARLRHHRSQPDQRRAGRRRRIRPRSPTTLDAAGMGQILDIVPNHMAVDARRTRGGATCSRTGRAHRRAVLRHRLGAGQA